MERKIVRFQCAHAYQPKQTWRGDANPVSSHPIPDSACVSVSGPEQRGGYITHLLAPPRWLRTVSAVSALCAAAACSPSLSLCCPQPDYIEIESGRARVESGYRMDISGRQIRQIETILVSADWAISILISRRLYL